ncbi:hypothetical protein Tco_0322608 [Tanacetum coccineum]
MHIYVSHLKDAELKTLIATYDIPLDLRPRLPDSNFSMSILPAEDTTIEAQSLSLFLGCVSVSVQSLQSNPSPPFLYTSFSAIEGLRVFCVLPTWKSYRGNGEVGNGMGRAGKCTREVVLAINHGGGSFEVDFVCTMAEIGCNWARIGPSKSSQSLSIAHKWAVEID